MASPNSNPKLQLQPNVPELIALKFATGKPVSSNFSDEKQVFFSLVDGRSAFLGLDVAQSIANLQLGNREAFYICKKTGGQAGYIDVWLSPEGEKARAADEAQTAPAIPAQPSEFERQALASLAAIQERKLAPGPVVVPPRPEVQGWGKVLLAQTNSLIDIYAQACKHAETQGVPPAVVRTVMLSAFIGIQRNGGTDAR
jgi:hypothetical protein